MDDRERPDEQDESEEDRQDVEEGERRLEEEEIIPIEQAIEEIEEHRRNKTE